MAPVSLGRVNVTTSGTEVRLASVLTPCNRIRVQAIAGLTGKVYFGTVGVNHTTLAGVVKVLAVTPTGGVDDAYEVATQDGTNTLNLADYWIDAAVNGEGVIVAYWAR